MSWAIGFVDGRDVGYSVPAICEYPDCSKEIDRGLAFACGGFPDSEYGCGLFFCDKHMTYAQLDPDDEGSETVQCCDRCAYRNEHPDDWQNFPEPYERKPDTMEWVIWKLEHHSWKQWRKENPDEVKEMKARVAALKPTEYKHIIAKLKKWGLYDKEEE